MGKHPETAAPTGTATRVNALKGRPARNRGFVLFALLLLPFFIFAQTDATLRRLRQQVADSFSAQKGVFALAFKDLKTGKELLINEHEFFHAASTMKTPVMIEVFNQVAQKKFSLNDSLLIKNEFKSIADSSFYSLDSAQDSEFEIYHHEGEKRSVKDLMYQMIIASSNFSTNLVIALVNARKVTQTMRALGALDMQVLRGVEDQKAFDKGLNNTTTAYDLMTLFEKIAGGRAVSREASAAMIKILLDQQFNEIIPAQLPAGTKVAHKTGSITGVQHDSGIVFLPDGHQYVVVLLSKQLEDEAAGVKTMASVSGLIYRTLYKK